MATSGCFSKEYTVWSGNHGSAQYVSKGDPYKNILYFNAGGIYNNTKNKVVPASCAASYIIRY